jgi:DNA-binding PadR family transcriptional regulator
MRHPFMYMKRKGFGFPRGGGPFGEGPFGEDHFGKGGHRRFRQRRGDIKFVLLELIKVKPYHGYELIKAIEESSGGFYRPSPGTVYPTLQMLEEEGNLTSEMIEDKKVYTITDAGRKLLQEQEALHQSGFGFRRKQQPDMPPLVDLRRAGMALFESAMQAGRYGTPEQIKAVQEVLESANTQVHSILAQKGTSDNV